MGNEIERRFLVIDGFQWDLRRMGEPFRIRQGYLELPDPLRSYRIRIINNEVASHAIKIGEGISRRENEERLNLFMARTLMESCYHRLSKNRYIVPRTAGRDWEIDVFEGTLQGIMLVEAELDSPDEKLQIPAWCGNVVEVTDSLTNLHLARMATDLTSTKDEAVPALKTRLSSHIKRIVIAGPAGCGKSSLIADLKKRYPDIHFVPEVASIIISQLGIRPPTSAVEENRFQQAVYRTQKIFERTSTEYAIASGMRAVVFDRGTVDSPAYLSGGIPHFEELCRTTMQVEYDAYDGVLFLGLPCKETYDDIKDNNPARIETYEQACEQEKRIWELWSTHPNRSHIYDGTNRLSWQEKVDLSVTSFDYLLQ